MSGHKYITNSSNLFEDDDVDDETFLKNVRRSNSDNHFVDQAQSFKERKKEVEQRTLNSTHRSLGLLHETEQVGAATAEELSRQREQLENTSKQLDDINTTLRFSQKHLNGLKSVFGGLKNYLSGQKDMGIRRESTQSVNSQNPKFNDPNEYYDQARGNTSNLTQTMHNTSGGTSFNEQLDRNLDEMAGSLSRLKGLAIDLNQDIESQNDLIDNITNKVEDVDLKIDRQNKDMNKLLGKK